MIKLFSGFAFLFAGISLIAWTVFFWFSNPALTEMQMLQEYWHYYLVASASLFVSFKLIVDD